MVRDKGVADGGRGGQDPRTKTAGTTPKLGYFNIFSLETYNISAIPNILKIKWLKFEKKINVGGMWVRVPMNPSSPQSKLRGDALG